MIPRIAVLTGPGTNCDEETFFSLKYLGADVQQYMLSHVKQNPKIIRDFQAIIIPGGFTYGDYIGAGRIFAKELEMFLKEEIERFLKKGGFIFGICNGFQILTCSKLLPGISGWFSAPTVSLISNDSLKYEDRWVYLSVESSSFWFKNLPKIIKLPVAHAEGKFFAEKETIEILEKNKQIALRYVNPEGNEAFYPYNPNGSIHGIAGITDRTGQILGMMPHPERFFSPEHSLTGNSAYPYGRLIFKNLVEEIKGRFSV